MLQWGNVHLSMARKFLDEAAIKGTFEERESRIQSEFDTAAGKYREALSIKADFYDGEMQLGQVDFERAKLAAGFIPEPVRCCTNHSTTNHTTANYTLVIQNCIHHSLHVFSAFCVALCSLSVFALQLSVTSAPSISPPLCPDMQLLCIKGPPVLFGFREQSSVQTCSYLASEVDHFSLGFGKHCQLLVLCLACQHSCYSWQEIGVGSLRTPARTC